LIQGYVTNRDCHGGSDSNRSPLIVLLLNKLLVSWIESNAIVSSSSIHIFPHNTDSLDNQSSYTRIYVSNTRMFNFGV